MNFQEAVTSCLKRYVDFNGRSARSEFWYFYLFFAAVLVVLSLLQIIVMGMSGGPNGASGAIGAISNLVSLGLFLPFLGAFVRRMHDTNRSGWWYFIAFTVVGLIPLIIWLATRGTLGENRFGPDPLGGEAAPSKPDSAWVS